MIKLVSAVFLILASSFYSLNGIIIETTQIEEIKQEITSDSLVLFNIAEVLLDTETSLGTQAWRKYIRHRVDSKTHDDLTLYVFKQVPPKVVEEVTPGLISDLQVQNIPVLAFTSRGRNEWYFSKVENVDIITEDILRRVGIDFSQTKLPSELSDLDSSFGDYYHEGIIYATNGFEKGEVLKKLLETTNYRPSKIIFVDDKVDSLKSVEQKLEELGIPFVGYAYTRTAQDHANFDPLVSTIQLDWLISKDKILSDDEAEQLRPEIYITIYPEQYFERVIQKWKSREQD